MSLLPIYRSEPFFIEIVPKGVDKGDSLRRLTEHTRANSYSPGTISRGRGLRHRKEPE